MADTSASVTGAGDASLRWTGFLAPLNLVACVTWAAVAIDALLRDWGVGTSRKWSAMACLGGMLLLFLLRVARDQERTSAKLRANILAQAALIVQADWLLGGGQPIVLLIIVAAQAVWSWTPRGAALVIAAFNALVLLRWSLAMGQFWPAALQLLPIVAFQAFAALTAHFAGVAERSRASLARINAELLATQNLLEQSARTDERLRLSRELHDVSGHKLTALKLQLSMLARDAAFRGHPDLGACVGLVDELLADIRGVVGALRLHDGLALAETLRALGRPMGAARIDVEVPPDLRVASVAHADALLRAAQEGITNALRHGGARHVRVVCHHGNEGVVMQVTNDGIRPHDIRMGNGLTGMRERLQALGGRVHLEPGEGGDAVRLDIWLPDKP